MRYGLPSLSSAFEEFAEQAIKEVFVLPLYPQWSQSTTDSVILKVDELNAIWKVKIDYLSPFYQDKGFLKSHQELIENSIQKFNPDFVIFSFHGLPDKPVAQRYFRECHETAKLLSFYLKNIPWKTSFQSRLGFNKWLEPSTENTIAEAAQKGFLRLMVVSPSFVVDGLETHEELALEGAEQFKKLTHDKGQFYLVPSLNLSPTWVETVQQWVHQHFQSGKL
jgi:ferrochelatase